MSRGSPPASLPRGSSPPLRGRYKLPSPKKAQRSRARSRTPSLTFRPAYRTNSAAARRRLPPAPPPTPRPPSPRLALPPLAGETKRRPARGSHRPRPARRPRAPAQPALPGRLAREPAGGSAPSCVPRCPRPRWCCRRLTLPPSGAAPCAAAPRGASARLARRGAGPARLWKGEPRAPLPASQRRPCACPAAAAARRSPRFPARARSGRRQDGESRWIPSAGGAVPAAGGHCPRPPTQGSRFGRGGNNSSHKTYRVSNKDKARKKKKAKKPPK